MRITPEEARTLVAGAIAAGRITIQPPTNNRGGKPRSASPTTNSEYLRRYRAEGKRRGICLHHIKRPAPVVPGRIHCAACLEKRRTQRHAKAKGICWQHIERPVPVVPGHHRCAECLTKRRTAATHRANRILP